jgi:hypothetical protein
VGDGVALIFSDVTHVEIFSICLRISDTTVTDYPIPDFGYSTADSAFIYPLGWRHVAFSSPFYSLDFFNCIGISNITSVTLSGSTFWCAETSLRSLHPISNGILVFPVYRDAQYDTISMEYVTQQTLALMYTLGVLYSILGMAFLLIVVRNFDSLSLTHTHSLYLCISLPLCLRLFVSLSLSFSLSLSLSLSLSSSRKDTLIFSFATALWAVYISDAKQAGAHLTTGHNIVFVRSIEFIQGSIHVHIPQRYTHTSLPSLGTSLITVLSLSLYIYIYIYINLSISIDLSPRLL